MPPNAAATRTHARRSCEVCQIRKTRCELPDVNVQSSTDPQPVEMSCHRCRTLVLPCVVNDEGRKRGLPVQEGRQRNNKRKKRSEANGHAEAVPSTSGPENSFNTLSEAQPSHPSRKDGQLLHTFLPYDQERATATNGQPSRTTLSDMHPPKKRVDTIRIHGKPWRLACAMLGAAYGNGPPVLDLDSLLNEEMKKMLEPGSVIYHRAAADAYISFSSIQLRTYHPHLRSLADMYSDYERDHDSANTLLLSLVVYLSTLSLPSSPDIIDIRNTLIPAINYLQRDLSIFNPSSLQARQAIELLALHCPLGVFPTEGAGCTPIDLHEFSSLSVSEQYLNHQPVARLDGQMSQLDEQEAWLWLGLVATKATAAMEDDDNTAVESLKLAGTLASQYLDASMNTIMAQDADLDTMAVNMGKLALCDRILRLVIAHDTLARLHQQLVTLAENPFFEIFPSIGGVLERSQHLFAEADVRHEVSMRKSKSFAMITAHEHFQASFRSTLLPAICDEVGSHIERCAGNSKWEESFMPDPKHTCLPPFCQVHRSPDPTYRMACRSIAALTTPWRD